MQTLISASRMHSSLHTIRPMASPANEMTPAQPETESYFPQETSRKPGHHSLQFPFRQNAIARKARSPGPSELEFQFQNRNENPANRSVLPAEEDIPSPVLEEGIDNRRISQESDGGIGGPVREIMEQRVAVEQGLAKEEEGQEIDRCEEEGATPSSTAPPGLATPLNQRQNLGYSQEEERAQSEENVAAALREGSDEEEIVEDRMQANPQEKKRVRREILAERLQEVFGLEHRETVLEEMRCWLLRSVSELISFR